MKNTLLSLVTLFCLGALPLLMISCSSSNESTSPEKNSLQAPDRQASTDTTILEDMNKADDSMANWDTAMLEAMQDAHAKIDSPFSFEVPEGWQKIDSTAFRNPHFQIGQAQAYVTMLGGAAGGLTMNINRWSGQMGGDDLTDEQIDNLEKIDLLGKSVPLFEAAGVFQGMQNDAHQDNAAMLATAWTSDDFSIFVKMIGPEKTITANRQAFIDFCKSLALKVPNHP